MLSYCCDYCYLPVDGAELFTITLLPEKEGKFPVVILRTPYVDVWEEQPEENAALALLNERKKWLSRGYAIVCQHCRGRGKSTGDCIPYINERKDGLLLQEWVRKQPFYNGEIYLTGGSYTTSVHYVTAPFAPDIKGAVFGVQDCDRYNASYCNGFFKRGLHGNWYVKMYKAKSIKQKAFTPDTFNLLPMKDFCKTVFGEEAEDLNSQFRANLPSDPYWDNCDGITNTRGVTRNLPFPALFTTAFFDLYAGGIFKMWQDMTEESRNRNALVISPYDHGDRKNPQEGQNYPCGHRAEAFGENYEIDWFDYLRGVRKESPFPQGKVTYYRLFENRWETDDFAPAEKEMLFPLGEKEITYTYNPFDPPSFPGGLSRGFDGACYQDPPGSRHDIITVHTPPFEQDTFVKGKMKMQLQVKSDCEDTCFYVRISGEKDGRDMGLRDDITSLSWQLGNYTPGTEAQLQFSFDEIAFLIRKGQRLRIDIASANNRYYIRHTNQKGHYFEQETAKIAHNTVDLQHSSLTLPIE